MDGSRTCPATLHPREPGVDGPPDARLARAPAPRVAQRTQSLASTDPGQRARRPNAIERVVTRQNTGEGGGTRRPSALPRGCEWRDVLLHLLPAFRGRSIEEQGTEQRHGRVA